jgi:hypothetical protein
MRRGGDAGALLLKHHQLHRAGRLLIIAGGRRVAEPQQQAGEEDGMQPNRNKAGEPKPRLPRVMPTNAGTQGGRT